jgi:hypothetical protein
VWPDAEIWSQLNTYLFPMAFLALFGLQLSHGLTCHWWIFQIWQIIFFSLHFLLDSGGLRARRFFLQLIWFLCVWIIWNESTIIQKLRTTIILVVGKGQALLAPVVKDNKSQFSL